MSTQPTVPGGGEEGRHSRLSVNIGQGVEEALREAMEADGISATEAVRQAFSVWKFVRDQQAAGYAFGLISPKDETVREVIFP